MKLYGYMSLSLNMKQNILNIIKNYFEVYFLIIPRNRYFLTQDYLFISLKIKKKTESPVTL